MEYMLPLEAFRDCFQAIRQRIKERHRQYVGWRVLCAARSSPTTVY